MRLSSTEARKYRHDLALRFTRGLKDGDLATLVEVYEDALKNQGNASQAGLKDGEATGAPLSCILSLPEPEIQDHTQLLGWHCASWHGACLARMRVWISNTGPMPTSLASLRSNAIHFTTGAVLFA